VAEALRSVRRLRDGNVGLSPKDQRLRVPETAPYEAATKFIGDNELPMTYLDQVANFITQNTQGATIGQSP
jgi:hypothetical protein